MNSTQIKRLLEDYKPIEILEMVGLDDTERLLEHLDVDSHFLDDNRDEILENLEVNGVI